MTLEQAISRAQANEANFAIARAEAGASALERANAKSALLPTVTYHNQYVYTQPNNVAASRIGQTAGSESPKFIANNAIHEYASQGLVDEKIGLSSWAAIKAADAKAAIASAELEVARRGLVTAVAGLYFDVISEEGKTAVAQRALNEANRFVDVTEKRETQREAAHADVLKAHLQQQQRQRELSDSKVAAEKAKLELGVLLYPDPTTSYQVSLQVMPPPLPDRAAIDGFAKQNNPEIRSAAATLAAAQADTFSNRAALLPDLAMNYTYGIDASNFGVNGPDGIRNLGYSASAGLDIPVWDWLATERKIKASKLRADAAKVGLTAAQRRLLANLQEFYAEAEVAQKQLASLDGSVMDARESLRLTNLRYVDGESTVLEVVDAQTALITAETAQLDGQTRYQAALANLQTLTGRF